jgi:hypothetical protein
MRKWSVVMALACVGAGATAGTAAVASGAAPGGTLKGRTAQGRAIRLASGRGAVTIERFSIELRCADGSSLLDLESGFQPTPVRRGGQVSDRQAGSTDQVLIRGRLRGRRLGGKIRVRDRWGRVRCDSRWVRFRATRSPGRGPARRRGRAAGSAA